MKRYRPLPPTVNVPKNATWRNSYLAYLVNKFDWRAGAELGVWKGDTFLHLLEHCPQLWMIGVDLWAPQPNNAGPEDWSDQSRWPHSKNERYVRDQAARYAPRARIIKEFTDLAAHRVKDASLDFVFIDADHSTEGVSKDIRSWWPKLKETGWLIGHDIEWPSVRAAVDRMVPGYEIGPNVMWLRPKNPTSNWKVCLG